MTLFNSQNPRIAAAQQQVIETLACIPDEYGTVFLVDDYQAELMAAVAVGTHRIRRNAATLNRIGGRAPRPTNVIALAERRAS